MPKTFEEHVRELKGLGEVLMPYNYPLSSNDVESVVNWLKGRDLTVDGYGVYLHYSKSDFSEYLVETLQVMGRYTPFLPFNLVCKVARRFFGAEHLGLMEVFRDGRKIYCWTRLLDREGRPVPPPEDSAFRSTRTYENLTYHVTD